MSRALKAEAEACGISYDILSWTQEWHVWEGTLRAANLAVIAYHQKLPLPQVFGTGALSSSDGQRFPTRGKSVTARALSRYFTHEGLSTYTHVTDQHAIFGTKVIVVIKREAHYALDEILGNATEIPIRSLRFGHATASLLVGKLSASSRQNTLAAALKVYGRSRERSTPHGICRTPPAGARSPASSTKESRCTR